MRVIAGTARRLQLNTPVGIDTRPTTDRIKETLFNMITPYLPNSTFMDLFSGSGAIGIEALSRGAKEAVFIENNKVALESINNNLVHTNLLSKSTVLAMDVLHALKHLESQEKIFDIIFLDPPYHQDYEQQVMEYLKDSSLIHDNSTVIFEAAVDTNIGFVDTFNFEVTKVKKYKTNMHIFCNRI
jgi:16S rRNA (guanine966-N2)-methyltransferase